MQAVDAGHATILWPATAWGRAGFNNPSPSGMFARQTKEAAMITGHRDPDVFLLLPDMESGEGTAVHSLQRGFHSC